jgi:hypothetical protein
MDLRRYLRWAVFGVKPARRTPRRRRSGRGPARNWRYRAWVRTLPCAACGAPVSHAAHTGDDGGIAQKPSDYSCVPLCFLCHAEYDNGFHSGVEFEMMHGISMKSIVRDLNRLWFKYAAVVR